MAVLSWEKLKRGRRARVMIRTPHGRHTIRLGKVSERIAETARRMVESLQSAKAAGHSPDRETADWVGRLGDEIHARLARAGLVPPRERPEQVVHTLGQHLARYFASLGEQKKTTANNYARAGRLLEEFFGKDRPLKTIVEGDADDYRSWLLGKFAPASASVDLRRARQYFKAAVRRRLIESNPFEGVKCGSQANPARKFFVTRETIEAVIAACPDNDWRLIFAFARYAGLRIPSEIANLRWSDVNWERQRITIHVPKKAHLPGHEARVLPIFPELRPHLDRAFAEAADRAELVVPRARGGRNLRRYAEQIIKKAGVQQWPKLFQNCRASRETELMQSHPAHVVLAWVGHTAAVARAHYLTVTDGDFARATGGGEASEKAPGIPAPNPTPSTPVSGHQEPSSLLEPREKPLEVREKAENQYPRQGSNL